MQETKKVAETNDSIYIFYIVCAVFLRLLKIPIYEILIEEIEQLLHIEGDLGKLRNDMFEASCLVRKNYTFMILIIIYIRSSGAW